MKKIKLMSILLIAILVVPAALTLLQSSRSNGEGKVVNQSFLVSASVQPNITCQLRERGGDRFATNVTAVVTNYEKVDVYGVATATVGTGPGVTQTQSSPRTMIGPGETKWIYISFVGLPYEIYYACFVKFVAEPIQSSAGGGGSHTTSPGGGSSHTTVGASGGGSDLASVGLAVVGVVVVAFCAVAGFMVVKKTRLSEQKVKRFTSYEYQDWVMQRLGARAGSVLDSRKGIDAFTSANVPLMIKQSDNVGRLQVDSFMNALTQAKVRSGVMVAFGYDGDAFAAVSRAKMNRIDIKLVTVKELIDHKDTPLL